MTKMLQSNKKIRTRENPPTNNKILVLIGTLRQPAIFQEIPATNYKIWSILVMIREIVFFIV